MSERGRGGGGGRGRGGGDNRGRGGGQQGRGGGGQRDGPEKKQSILDLSKYVDKKVRVKFTGGRECIGTLKGYDPLLNLVLDETEEFIRDPQDHSKLLDETRSLGLVVCRGTSVILICPTSDFVQIANPFAQS
ncbi:U6 snRNA-associated Sm-like protein LSm7 [Hyaloraphidium curvatum]|nr:U6 snRNA-associated Sm-like protein LSm7 [Hyaloraphidium curvatum]